MAHNKVRVRCPVCGMLVWQSRMNKDYPFEFVIQEISGKGYQQIQNRYKKAFMADTDAAKIFQSVLAMKMVEKAEALLKKIDADIKIDVQMSDETEEELAEAYEEVTREAEHEVEPREAKHEVEHKKQYIHEFQVSGVKYEVEVPTLRTDDVKRPIFRRRKRPQEIKEMTAISEMELNHDIIDLEYMAEVFHEVIGRGRGI